ncbi:Transketolase, thiamine diphosphate binding domain-containing protein [Lipomyces oligophaga]|uniref:Transketolase, thiamine diphosphate binding domain-containing protein n=1 Tax=Lipomyces oligophaga TaxID=45792 RepID=UPI0034CE2CD4
MTKDSNSPKSLDVIATREIRKLVMDLCRQNGGGHGGSAVGMAGIAVALWKHTMVFNPASPAWFARDRFVLSNGHAATLQYCMLHITGYKQFTMDQLRGYGHPKPRGYETVCFAHPEIEFDGVEFTTGPLGQGIAAAVGMAIAAKQLASTYNKPSFPVVQGNIFCSTGDGCLMEGVAIEAMAIAGRLALDNLILIYDNNDVTCDGPLDWIVTENTNAKVQAMGWHTIDVYDGDHNVSAMVDAINLAKSYTDGPTMINIRTTIGYNTEKAGTAGAHHGTFSDGDIIRVLDGATRPSHFVVPEVYEYFAEAGRRGAQAQADWEDLLQDYSSVYPKEAAELKSRIEGKPLDLSTIMKSVSVPENLIAAREVDGDIFNQIFKQIPHLFAGGADLWGANKLGAKDHVVFDKNDYSGRVVRYGIREHAMAGVSNGIAAYQPGAFIPITATFLMFYLYAAPAVRMGALNDLQVIHVATHDSFQEGQNGPTHQPVEVDSLFRAMPHMQYIRPSSGEEIIAAWMLALGAPKKSSLISVARDAAEFPPTGTCRDKALLGGYVLSEVENAQVTLISCGSALGYTQQAAAKLTNSGIPTRVVSMPSICVFEAQSESYKNGVLGSAARIVSVEEYVPTVWARFCSASIGMKTFGYSASGPSNYDRFGMDVEGIFSKITGYMNQDVGRWRIL